MAQSFLIQESVLLPTCTDYSNLAVPGASSIKLPRSGGFTVQDKQENVSADAQVITYASDTITFSHRTVQFLIEKLAARQSVVDVVSDAVMKATKALALDIDEKILAEINLGSASAPDHQIVFADTVNDVLAKGDILAARKLLIDQNINPRECFLAVGSEKEAEMLAIEGFVDASKYGSASPVMLGEIGMVYGMRVLVHTSISDYMVAWHPSAVGYAFSQPIELDFDKDLANIGMRYSLDYIFGAEVLDGGKRCVKVDSTN
jgi:N4-gp56 family major capsid protein